MPKVIELKEIDGELWARIGEPGHFPSGVALWTPDEQEQAKAALRADLEAVAVAAKPIYDHLDRRIKGDVLSRLSVFVIGELGEALARPGVEAVLEGVKNE